MRSEALIVIAILPNRAREKTSRRRPDAARCGRTRARPVRRAQGTRSEPAGASTRKSPWARRNASMTSSHSARSNVHTEYVSEPPGATSGPSVSSMRPPAAPRVAPDPEAPRRSSCPRGGAAARRARCTSASSSTRSKRAPSPCEKWPRQVSRLRRDPQRRRDGRKPRAPPRASASADVRRPRCAPRCRPGLPGGRSCRPGPRRRRGSARPAVRRTARRQACAPTSSIENSPARQASVAAGASRPRASSASGATSDGSRRASGRLGAQPLDERRRASREARWRATRAARAR
jgi:hypothetical protein